MASGNTEEQKYTVVSSNEEFEIRFYPSATLATVYMNAASYREVSRPGFRTLAGYIFGGNESETKISMTAPVHMNISEDRSSMSFVMPSSYNPDNLPKPDNSRVIIEETKDEYVAVIRFSGYASDNDIKKQSEKLRKLLIENGIEFYGDFRYLGYNSPYKFFNRRNEIIVSVR
ncbi:MAG: heme-binding protein [Marinilabiliales bacterium]|nr:MAG: heme-binding protein [Marinilabiliales bacterium]